MRSCIIQHGHRPSANELQAPVPLVRTAQRSGEVRFSPYFSFRQVFLYLQLLCTIFKSDSRPYQAETFGIYDTNKDFHPGPDVRL
ncbi:hypothetical protein OG21DRAFT_1287335 [Imleria badia]|nr:hypothetical protein OG21DRAFT_1287335 [Imleria badia]